MAKKTTTSKGTARKSAAPASEKEPELSFEDGLAQLEGIVQELEQGNLTLTEALERYENGITNLKHCYQMLRNAEQKVESLTRIDENGEVHVEDFDGEATSGPK